MLDLDERRARSLGLGLVGRERVEIIAAEPPRRIGGARSERASRRRFVATPTRSASGGPSNVCETGKSRTSIGSRPRSENRRGRFGPMAAVRPSDCGPESALKNERDSSNARRPAGVELNP